MLVCCVSVGRCTISKTSNIFAFLRSRVLSLLERNDVALHGLHSGPLLGPAGTRRAFPASPQRCAVCGPSEAVACKRSQKCQQMCMHARNGMPSADIKEVTAQHNAASPRRYSLSLSDGVHSLRVAIIEKTFQVACLALLNCIQPSRRSWGSCYKCQVTCPRQMPHSLSSEGWSEISDQGFDGPEDRL